MKKGTLLIFSMSLVMVLLTACGGQEKEVKSVFGDLIDSINKKDAQLYISSFHEDSMMLELVDVEFMQEQFDQSDDVRISIKSVEIAELTEEEAILDYVIEVREDSQVNEETGSFLLLNTDQGWKIIDEMY
ncbi:nuclear transport factor 2 family protein [Halalkalibacter alkaliphilus]|uniref:Nuclear transport factor 2 family protein n=1 Tax=Halalkalibacter alkaliphilus TaxID=2917993 RepID=A0A9X2CTT7_9BACI|nr:nuclear transport factor 2 family protein [Halalkalibacter alkaliphilus]MCL7748025.1 nuclear transport factor 2 family protein [Halalkalibacter alkaliphilus]